MNLLRRQFLLSLAILFASAVLVGEAMGDQKGKRPTISDALDCADYDCEGGIICSCCYDDGCWICNAQNSQVPDLYKNCEWQPAARRKGVTKIRPGSGVLDPGPPMTNTKPYSVPGGTGVFSK